jgi:AcrR family transcriptional regulator
MDPIKGVLAKRQEAERQERVDRILVAARKIFLQKGYLRATIRDIALEAELSPGLIYHYFDNKDSIYGKICEEAFQILLQTIAKANLDHHPPLDKLEALARVYIYFYRDYPEYFEIISFKELGFKQVGLSDEILERLNQLSLKTLSMLNDAVVEGIGEGVIPGCENPWEITITLWAVIEGVIFVHKRGYLELFDLEIEQLFIRQIVPMLKNGVGAI